MTKAKVTVEFDAAPVLKAADKASFRNLGHAGGSIRKAAMASIRTSRDSSPPGSPPATRRGNLRRAIIYNVEKIQSIFSGQLQDSSVVIGPRASIVSDAGAAHELGEQYRGQSFAERPFMGPALADNVDRFADLFKDSITA